jgi:hypothetical protein
MTNVILSKILMGFLAIALVLAVGLFLFKIVNLIGRLLKFRLKFDDIMTIGYIGIIVTCCYFIGDWIN